MDTEGQGRGLVEKMAQKSLTKVCSRRECLSEVMEQNRARYVQISNILRGSQVSKKTKQKTKNIAESRGRRVAGDEIVFV